MNAENVISEEWLADRAMLHDAQLLQAAFDGRRLELQIDDEWPNLAGEPDRMSDPIPATLRFEGVTILAGNIEEANERFINELSFDSENWHLYLARPRFFSKRGHIEFSADAAHFEAKQN